jgi:hypothetical protein
MVRDPRSPKPGSSEPDEALDLLRALARSRETRPAWDHGPSSPNDAEADKLDALRALAETLDRQLKAPHGATEPDPAPWDDEDRPAAAPGWREAARREWDSLAAALPRAAELVPRLDRERIIFVVAAVAVLALAAVGGVLGNRTARDGAPETTVAPPAQIVPPTAQAPAQVAPAQVAPTDLPAITKAMSDCDAAAARDPDSLYFLVLPLVQANRTDNSWRAIALQTVGNSYLLLSAKDALDGLRDGKLVLRPNRYTFSALDSGTGATYSWTSATGLSRLARKDSGAVKTLKLGFDFSEAQTGAQWSAEFKRDRGICYWVTALVRE